MDASLISNIKSHFDTAKNILILLKTNPSIDETAAGLALYESFKKQNKIVSIASPTPLTVSYTHLFSIDKIENNIGSKNLVISLDYAEGSIEKVSYNVEGDKFNLIVQPKTGFPPFSKDKVSFSYSGINADLIFTLGCSRLEDLERFYFENKSTFEKIPIINISLQKSDFGKINLVNHNSPACSQIVLDLLKSMDFKIDPDTASNLLTGIESATNGLSQILNADTFEAVALCLRLGAKRYYQAGKTSVMPDMVVSSNVIPTSSTPLPIESVSPAVVKPEETSTLTPSQSQTPKPPPDWLQPKIYKGGSLL